MPDTSECLIPATLLTGHIQSSGPLTLQAIKELYQLDFKDIERITSELHQMTLLDILFSYPDGPFRDIAVYMMSTSR